MHTDVYVLWCPYVHVHMIIPHVFPTAKPRKRALPPTTTKTHTHKNAASSHASAEQKKTLARQSHTCSRMLACHGWPKMKNAGALNLCYIIYTTYAHRHARSHARQQTHKHVGNPNKSEKIHLPTMRCERGRGSRLYRRVHAPLLVCVCVYVYSYTCVYTFEWVYFRFAAQRCAHNTDRNPYEKTARSTTLRDVWNSLPKIDRKDSSSSMAFT